MALARPLPGLSIKSRIPAGGRAALGMMGDSKTLKVWCLPCANSHHPLGLLISAFQAGISLWIWD